MFSLIAALWLIFGIGSVLHTANTANRLILWIVPILMLTNVGVMLGLAWGLGKKPKTFFYLALGIMVVNIFLTIADEVGVYDLLMLLAEAVIVVYLITKRSSYLSTNS
jgi:predicted membrane channel-forming protein YqfA (hemolysin III family)